MKRLLLLLLLVPTYMHAQTKPWANLTRQVDSNQTFARNTIEKSIFIHLIAPFIYANLKDTARLSNRNKPVSYDEADWRALKHLIGKVYGKSYVKINLLHARLAWYKMHNNWRAYEYTAFRLFEARHPDTTKLQECDLVDLYANLLYKASRKQEAIKWQIEAVKMQPANKSHLLALRAMIKGEPTYRAQIK